MREAEVARLLGESPPFSSLPPDERARLAGGLRAHRFDDGQALFHEGDAAREGWLVAAGAVRVLIFGPGNKLVQVERLGRGELAGIWCRVGRRVEAQQCTALAEGPVTALRVPDEVFDRFMAESETFSREACRSCAARLGSMRRAAVAGRETVERRVAAALVRMAAAQGATVKATRHRLAVDAGTALETVFRVLARFRRRGWIKTGRGVVLVRDAAALRAVAGLSAAP